MAIEIMCFKPFSKHTLQGFITLRMTAIGLEIRDATLHQKGGRRWLQLPSKSYEKDGQMLWAGILDFYDKFRAAQFQRSALDALDQFIAKGQGGGDGF